MMDTIGRAMVVPGAWGAMRELNMSNESDNLRRVVDKSGDRPADRFYDGVREITEAQYLALKGWPGVIAVPASYLPGVV